MNDPRPQNPYGKLYSVEFLGNMVGGQRTLYNNQPIQVLKKAAADSIKEGEVGGVRWAGLHQSWYHWNLKHCPVSLRRSGLAATSESISTTSWASMT